jgi:uncharacterized protein (TIGR03083 family)
MDTTARPVPTAHLFAPLHDALLALLRGLGPGDWDRPTRAGRWTVRDVAAHLLDADLRRLSWHRDGHPPPPPDRDIRDHAALVGWLGALNAEWVRAMRRLGPRVLTDLLERSGRELAAFVERLDPDGPALFPVAWAAESQTACWLDIGRELTERWHHQQQIRAAVGAPPIDAPALLGAVVAVSVLALPRAWAAVPAADGTAIAIVLDGPAGGRWALVRAAGEWRLRPFAGGPAAARIRGAALAGAHLLLHALDDDAARAAFAFDGPPALTQPFLRARAVLV